MHELENPAFSFLVSLRLAVDPARGFRKLPLHRLSFFEKMRKQLLESGKDSVDAKQVDAKKRVRTVVATLHR